MTGFTRRASLIDAFWDAIVRGEPRPDATGIPPEQADTVRWFQRLSTPVPDPNRDRAWSALEQRIRDEHEYEETNAMTGAYALAPTVRPTPPSTTPSPRALAPSLRSRTMTWLSVALLIALLGALAYGILVYQDRTEPTLPAVVGTPSPESSLLGSDWGQFRGGVERTGYTSDPGPSGDLNLVWSFTAEESLNGVMEAGGKVIAYGSEGGLYAIDALTGEQLWAIDLSPSQAPIQRKALLPAISGGAVFASTQEGVLVAVDAEHGDVRWQSDLTGLVTSSPMVDGETVYVVTDHARLHALDVATGSEQRASDLPASMVEQPTLAGGVFYYPADSGELVALDATSGALIWKSDNLSVHRVAAYQDGKLYAPTPDGALVAFDAKDGTVLWQAPAAGGEGLNPVVTSNSVILAAQGKNVRSFDPNTGEVQWSIDTPGLGNESPHAAGKTLYLLLDEQHYEAVDLGTGNVLATADTPGAGSTTAISGSLLFVSGSDGPIRAFVAAAGSPIATEATPPATAYVATPPAGEAANSEGVQAPVSGDIAAIQLLSIAHPGTDPTLGLFATPDGLLWRIGITGAIEVLDRDGNLLETRPHNQGSGPGEFDLIYSSSQIDWGAVGLSWLGDKTYITDMSNHRVQVFDADGAYLESWGEQGDADGQLQAPDAIASTPDGELVVVDLIRGDVQWFDAAGKFLRKLTGPSPGQRFVNPVDVAFDGDGNFWVLDTTLAQLFKFTPDGSLLLTIGNQPGSAEGQFSEPSDIDIDSQGRVWVADQSNTRLQVFDLQGNLIGIFDPCGTDIGCFRRPGLVLAGGNDFLYVLDYDIAGIEDEYIYKLKITSMPTVPMMAAATPAASEASPSAG